MRATAAFARAAIAGSYFDRKAAHCRAGVSLLVVGTSDRAKT